MKWIRIMDMKALFDQIEAYLESLIEGHSDRLFGTVSAEKKLIRQFLDAIKDTVQSDLQDNLVAPNNFSLNVPLEYLEEIRSSQPVLEKLSENLSIAANQAGIRFHGKVNISVFPDKDLEPGDFSVHAIWRDEALSETAPSNIASGSLQAIQPHPKAFLIVGGTQIYTLEDNLVNIGRQLENDLVINDPRVSRRHAQVRVVKGRHILFDLDSSGGTLVNNKPIKQSSLHPGDVISLAGVPLVYGHDSVTSTSDTKEYRPPLKEDLSGVSSTTRKLTPDEQG